MSDVYAFIEGLKYSLKILTVAKYLLILFIIFSFLLSPIDSIYSQDRGKPVFQVISYYSMIGGLFGAATASIIWATDPLNPNQALTELLVYGLAIGVPVGLVFGVNKVLNSVSREIPQDYYFQNPDDPYFPNRVPDPNEQLDPNRRYPPYPPADRYNSPDSGSRDWYDQYDEIIREDVDFYNFNLNQYNLLEENRRDYVLKFHIPETHRKDSDKSSKRKLKKSSIFI